MGTDRKWPFCIVLERECIAHEVATRIGTDLLGQFLTFINSSEEGSRLILQRNRDSFTVQVTGAVHRGVSEVPSLEDLKLGTYHNSTSNGH